MTAQEKAIEIRDSFIDVTKNFHPEKGWLNDLDSARVAGIIALNIMKQTRRSGPDYDYSFWDEVEQHLENGLVL